MRDRIEKHTEK